MIKFRDAIALVAIFAAVCQNGMAQTTPTVCFNDYFENATLRADYIFAGDHNAQHIFLAELASSSVWAGRRHHLDQVPLKGNGDITISTLEGKVIYRTSFSSLFQEWLVTEECRTVARSYENVFLLPMPKQEVYVDVRLFDNRQHIIAELRHKVNPSDILIRSMDSFPAPTYKYIHQSGSAEEMIDVAIIAEGYTAEEMEKFYDDARSAVEAIFCHKAFACHKDKFNFVAVCTPSPTSGVSVPLSKDWHPTVAMSHFSTFYSDRYLTTNRMRHLYDQLSGVPFEHLIILANTDVYGGGGIYNSYTLTTAHHKRFRNVVVHEFGHSFAGLADEYFYDNDAISGTYDTACEPWEQNITTLVDFGSKWRDMLPEGTPVPTPAITSPEGKYTALGVYEGGGYTSKGVYRPVESCRMRHNDAPDFCPVCTRAIERMISFYTER